MSELRKNQFWNNIDIITIILYATLVFIGWLSIYSAVYDENHQSILDIERNYGSNGCYGCNGNTGSKGKNDIDNKEFPDL